MIINFLSSKEAQELFKIPDSYAKGLPFSNLQMVNPKNPTLEGYQDVFLNSFGDFDQDDIERITEMGDKYFSKLNLTINMIKTNGTHSLDITQTRNTSILVTHGMIGELTFVHEVYHILSRTYPHLTPALSTLWGFKPCDPQEIKDESFLLNPDAELCNYSLRVVHRQTQKNFNVVPYVKTGLRTGLKVLGHEIYLSSQETNYEELISNTSYTAHPEEICAEHFALILTGGCIFRSPRVDRNTLSKYEEILRTEISNLNLNL